MADNDAGETDSPTDEPDPPADPERPTDGADTSTDAAGTSTSGADTPTDATASTTGSAGTDPATDATTPDSSETVIGESRQLEPSVRYLWVIGRVFGAVFLGGLVGVASSFLLGTTGQLDQRAFAIRVGAAVAVFFLLYAVVRAVLLYRSWRYVVREESLFLRRGVFTRVQTVVPYVRVQHIDTRRSPFERLIGLSSLVVYTAGSRGADVTIPGLTPDRAADLQARLERLAIESEDEDAV
jgi:membrane protein YdbS with pleckstrin-like domain